MSEWIKCKFEDNPSEQTINQLINSNKTSGMKYESPYVYVKKNKDESEDTIDLYIFMWNMEHSDCRIVRL